jgi:hypothetical protein
MKSVMSRDGIIAARAPGVAAQDSPRRQPRPRPGAMALEGLDRVVGAGGREPAMPAPPGREGVLVRANEGNQHATHADYPRLARSNSSMSSATQAVSPSPE